MNGGTKYYSDKVTVVGASGASAGMPVPMNIDKAGYLVAIIGPSGRGKRL